MNKVRFGLAGLYLRLTNDWMSLERHTADAWMRRWAGSKVYEMMWRPILVGKFGTYYRRSTSPGCGHASSRHPIGTFRGGFQAFPDLFADHLRGMGVEIRLNMPIQRISTSPTSGLTLEAGPDTERWDQVLVTTSPGLLARMAPGLQEGYLKGLLDLKSMGAVVMILALRHQLSEQGCSGTTYPSPPAFPSWRWSSIRTSFSLSILAATTLFTAATISSRTTSILNWPRMSCYVEAGYGATAAEAAETARAVIAAGAVGLNLEDGEPGDPPSLVEPSLHGAKILAVRRAADEAGVLLVINARTDGYWLGLGQPRSRFEETVERARAYLEAGADCIFVPGVTDRDTIRALARAVPGPLNVLATADAPPISELAELGVARVSVGSGFHRATLRNLQRMAQEYLKDGTYGSFTEDTLPYSELAHLLQD